MACADSDNPDDYQAWVDAGEDADAAHGYFGRIWTWCLVDLRGVARSGRGPLHGAVRHRDGRARARRRARWDPATRYEGAVLAHDLLPNSALLTVNSWGHTSLFTSACADDAIADYLISQDTPAPGAECDQDLTPWVDFGSGGP